MSGLGGSSRRALLVILLVALVTAACGSTRESRAGRTVVFRGGGSFPTATIIGSYSVRGCASDARAVAANARQYYTHSTTGPGPADLYYFDLRFAYANFVADACKSRDLGLALERGLTERQRRFLLNNVASNLYRPFRAALTN